jgi:Arc/MetJ-type ribon-helix-helix transcriptional regulator
MKKTLCVSVYEEMYEFIRMRVRDRWHYSISEYIRSLVFKDEASLVLPSKRSDDPDPRPANAIWDDDDDEE